MIEINADLVMFSQLSGWKYFSPSEECLAGAGSSLEKEANLKIERFKNLSLVIEIESSVLQ